MQNLNSSSDFMQVSKQTFFFSSLVFLQFSGFSLFLLAKQDKHQDLNLEQQTSQQLNHSNIQKFHSPQCNLLGLLCSANPNSHELNQQKNSRLPLINPHRKKKSQTSVPKPTKSSTKTEIKTQPSLTIKPSHETKKFQIKMQKKTDGVGSRLWK